MRIHFIIVLMLTTGSVRADKPKAKSESACKQVAGACCPDPATPRVRVCFSTPTGGAFEARIKYPDTLLIVLEGERPLRTVDPPSGMFTTRSRGNSIAITPERELSTESNVQIVTAHQRFTVTLRPAAVADAQVHIRDADKDAREAEIERRVAEALEAERKKMADVQKHMDEQAIQIAESLLLKVIGRSGIELRDVKGRAVRSQNVVLRPVNFARVGERRFILFSIQNRSSRTFHIKAVRLTADGREQNIKVSVAHQDLPADIADEQEIPGVLTLPAMRSGAKLRLTIEESDPQRNVSLAAEAP
jgi:hypothetical protein